MSLRISYTASARSEVSAAARWYDAQQRGTGRAFRAAVDRCAASVAAMPHAHAVVRGDARAAPVTPFAYLLFYRVQPTRILVVGVRHTARQDPAAGLGDEPAE